jgi:hypothetical protein
MTDVTQKWRSERVTPLNCAGEPVNRSPSAAKTAQPQSLGRKLLSLIVR